MPSELPKAFIEQMAARLGAELPDFLRAMEEDPCRAIRLNPMKRADEMPEGIGQPVPWEVSGYYLSLSSQAGGHALHEAGAWYLQEASAMLPAAVLDAQPGEKVLDLCAAPGGKTTQSALKMQGKGLIVCNEPVPKRAAILSRNVERMGIPNAVVTCAMPDQLAQRWPGGFDAVQVDAPCSGEGMFRRHPETRDEWTPDGPAGCARRQAEILDQAAILVRRGGRICYSTCTMNAAENEDTVAAFLQRHPDFRLQPFCLPGACGDSGMLTCYPHRMRGEGHFVALLVRDGNEPAFLPEDRSLPKPDKAQLALYRDFAGRNAPQPTAVLAGTLISLPDCPETKGLRILRAGLHLGEARGKVFQPDHAWALSMERPDFPTAELNEEQALLYQHGDTLPVDERLKGWVLPCFAGLALGWGKVSGGVMKNHYPKGLRRAR